MLEKCCFVLKLVFWLNIVSLLKLLQINAFLEAFHVPSFSGPEVFSGIFCRNVKVPERARTPLTDNIL